MREVSEAVHVRYLHVVDANRNRQGLSSCCLFCHSISIEEVVLLYPLANTFRVAKMIEKLNIQPSPVRRNADKTTVLKLCWL